MILLGALFRDRFRIKPRPTAKLYSPTIDSSFYGPYTALSFELVKHEWQTRVPK